MCKPIANMRLPRLSQPKHSRMRAHLSWIPPSARQALFCAEAELFRLRFDFDGPLAGRHVVTATSRDTPDVRPARADVPRRAQGTRRAFHRYRPLAGESVPSCSPKGTRAPMFSLTPGDWLRARLKPDCTRSMPQGTY